MDRLLRALSVSEAGIARMTISDKAGSLMEWNDDGNFHSAIFEKLFSRQMFEPKEAPLSLQFLLSKECSSKFRTLADET
jgi:hypothetical protein